MLELGISSEVKRTFCVLLDRVQGGEEIIITRHGQPAARLVPYSRAIDREGANAAVKRIQARAKRLKAGSFHWETLKADRDSGRP